MCLRYHGFFLLVWFQGVLHAQSAALPCHAPRLNGGYLVPEQEAYSHERTLSYACDNGRKPAVEGWWATSTCLNGTWSHEPQCIDEQDCLPPDIPNAKYKESQSGWYENGRKIRITCDNGYESKDRDATAKCINGTWTSVPVCEKSIHTCGEPPKIPHAVIIHRGYQEFFVADTQVQYECEDGYTVKGSDTKILIVCIAGNWTEGPTCSRETGPGAGQGGSAEVGTAGGHTTSTVSGTQSEGGGSRPGTGHGGSTVGGTGGGHTTSTGSGTRPAGGGSSTTSNVNDRRPVFTIVDHCGTPPVVPNAVVVQKDRLFLKYQCNSFYTQVGPDTVVCYSDGTWSQLPTCKATSCLLDPAVHSGPYLKVSAREYVKEGEKKFIPCIWTYYSTYVQCTDGILTLTRCCLYYEHYQGTCSESTAEESLLD